MCDVTESLQIVNLWQS